MTTAAQYEATARGPAGGPPHMPTATEMGLRIFLFLGRLDLALELMALIKDEE